MKRIVALLLTLMLGVMLLFSLASCGECEHTYGEWVVDREATESEVGERHRECTKCGDKITEEIPKLAHTHTFSKTWSYNDTCHWHAATCGDTDDIQNKSSHVFDQWIIDHPATENEVGERHSVCTVCKAKVTAKIPPLTSHTHTYGEWIVDCEATEDTVGAKHRVCTGCNKVENEEIPKLPHTHTYAEAWSYDDTYHFHASTCGHTDEVSEKAMHTYDNWITDRVATENAVGAKHRVCTVCNWVEHSEIEKLPHNHKYASAWSYDDTYHWHSSACGHEDAIIDKETHNFGSTGICICGLKEANVTVGVYIDGTLKDTLHTGLAYGFHITPPKKPEDITTNPNSEKYFCAWFIDDSFQTPLLDTTEFREDGAIYAKWVTVYSNDFRYTVNDGQATVISLSATSNITDTLVIPAYIDNHPVTAIGKDAFANNTKIHTLILCDGIKIIGGNAFYGCTGLTSITIPNSVTSIGGSAFYGCARLTKIVIPSSVTNIGSSAFYGCVMLTSITLPFVGATNGETGNTHFGYIFGAYDASVNNTYVPASLKNVILTGGTQIGNSAFSGCIGLSNITIPNSVTSIGTSAFSGCIGLTSLEIPSSVKSIGSSALSGCIGLTRITIPFVGGSLKNSSDTDQYPFGYIFGTTSYGGSIEAKQSYHSSSTYVISATYYIPLSLKAVNVLGGNILYGAFSGCAGLRSITIPNSSANIGEQAFYGCTGLTRITIPDSITSIGNSAFYGCAWLTNIEISKGVKNIGSSAFSNCIRLSAVTFANNSWLESIKEKTFSGCIGLTSITIPNSVTSIDESAFYGCTGLTSVTIPNSVTSIGSCAFYGCAGLTGVTIPNSVTSIGSSAFYSCTGLTSITIPNSVTSIGSSAFAGCRVLKDMYYSGSVSEWNAISKSYYWNYNTGNYTIHYNYKSEE